jgi:hypothetical protein
MFTQSMFYCVGAFLNKNLNDVQDKKKNYTKSSVSFNIGLFKMIVKVLTTTQAFKW